MKKIITIFALCVLGLSNLANAQTYLIEAEDFQFYGDWQKTYIKGERGLHSRSSRVPVTTVINLKQAGEYTVWASTNDYSKNAPKSRTYYVYIDGVKIPKKAGIHGKDGLAWENLGTIKLESGEHLMMLQPISNYIRTDAVLLTLDPSFNPETSLAERKKYILKPVNIKCEINQFFPETPILGEVKGGKKFEIKNQDIKIIYTEKKDIKGSVSFERSAEVFKNNAWVKLPAFADEHLFVTYAENASVSDGGYTAAWTKSASKAIATVAGKKIQIPIAPTNPYELGDVNILTVSKVSVADSKTFNLTFSDGSLGKLSLQDKGTFARFDVTYQTPKKGFYSLGMKACYETSRESVEASFLPTIYQGKRLMKEPRLVTTNITSQPVSLITANIADAKNKILVTYGVAANPEFLPFIWNDPSTYGLTLASPKNLVQPALFQPVLGNANSQKNEGDELKVSWYLYSSLDTWQDAFEALNSRIYAANYFREAFETSFSDAIANIATYMKNEFHSGWSPKHKARWNIEGKDLATTSAPLAEISVAMLTNDEEYYKRIALPTIEFTLTRKCWHFTTISDSNEGYGKKNYEMTVPNGSLKADYYASLDTLTGKLNPWLYEFTKDEKGALRLHEGRVPTWASLLGYQIANPSANLMEEIKRQADAWMQDVENKKYSFEPDFVAFINSGLYPYWWYMPELYLQTKDKKYLNFAKTGAFYTLTSIWNFPTPPEGDVIINKDNFARGVNTEWWRGSERFRVGYEPSKSVITMLNKIDSKLTKGSFLIAEKSVDARKISRVGMSIEQHSTYAGASSNILMPSWSAEMLKVASLTDNEMLLKFSRHSIIGRYANFLGYYFRDFTDVQHDEMYPYNGPDITSFYYHHAPCHFLQSMDYLMTQVEVASKNNIQFPYVREQGYVWFTDRVFAQPGKVFFDEKCRPMLDKAALRTSSPKLSTLMARGKNSIWAIILNDSLNPIETKVEFDSSAKSLQGAKYSEDIELFAADAVKSSQTFTFFGEKNIKIPAMSLVAMRIPAEDFNPEIAAKPLTSNAHIALKNVAEGWGDVHAFRIRSPFGKDSIYALATGGFEKQNSKIKVSITSMGKTEIVRDYFPYEVSMYPISMDSDLEFTISIIENGKEVYRSEKLTLKK